MRSLFLQADWQLSLRGLGLSSVGKYTANDDEISAATAVANWRIRISNEHSLDGLRKNNLDLEFIGET